jgi:tetratricopeptide (TPR) repeat protein
MGVVYEAADPELHREVALKVLRSNLGREQDRLLAEAQAMAKLTHPNVVTVHDVGRDGDRVFIVMALVRGVTLRHWLALDSRPVDAILDAFAQAAEGLRAAHEAGLVHRDFKPENVFVDREGRVLVGDFGLAVAGMIEGRAAAEGSLAYMAPEQRAGRAADARSDQYSFCLALAHALEESKGGKSSVPRWLRRLLARGLAPEPTRRFPSMSELVAAMADGRRRARRLRRGALALAAAAALGGVVVLAAHARARVLPVHPLCRDPASPSSAVWNAEVAARVERVFASTESKLWPVAWRQTEARMGGYADAWTASRQRACESARVRRDPVDAGIERRLSCLGDRLEIVRAMVGNLAVADAAMLEQIPSMLELLPRVEVCDDPRQLADVAPAPPADAVDAVESAKKRIARASTTIAAGRYREGLSLAEEASRAANAARFMPVMSDAYLWLGTAHGRLGEAREAARALTQAVSTASAARSQLLAVRAWIQLMHFIGYEEKRYEDGLKFGDYAKSALEAMPQAFELEAERLSWTRAMLLDEKRYDDALSLSHQELALVELRFGASHRLTAVALDGLAGGLSGVCRARDAFAPQEKSCAILEKELGPVHPQLALCLGNLAALHAYLGEHDAALEL